MKIYKQVLRPTVAAVTAIAALSWCGLAGSVYAEEFYDSDAARVSFSEELTAFDDSPMPIADATADVSGEVAADGVACDFEGAASVEEASEPMSGEGPSDETSETVLLSETPDVLEGGLSAADDSSGLGADGGEPLGEGSEDIAMPVASEDAVLVEEAQLPGEGEGLSDVDVATPGPDAVTADEADAAIDGVLEEAAPTVQTDALASDSAAQSQMPEVFDGCGVAPEAKAVPAHTGWVQENGRHYYYDNEGNKLLGSQRIDDAWYYFDSEQDGAMATGLVTVAAQGSAPAVTYFQGADGKRQTGEHQIDGAWYYFDSQADGARANAEFVHLTGSYLVFGPKTVYYDADGKMAYGEREVDGSWYYLDPSLGGARAESKFVYLDGAYLAFGPKTVYYDADGAMASGEREVDGSWYYLDPERGGERAHDRFVYLNGDYLANGPKTVYYGSDGKMDYGEQQVDGDWYYLDPVKGGDCAHDRYVLLSGSYLANGPKQVYYGPTGKMLKGPQVIDGQSVYFDYFSGALAKRGWQNPNGLFQVSSLNVRLPDAAYGTGFDYVTPSRIGLDATRDECVEVFIQRAYEYLGTPYRWDYALAPGVGVDCAGLVMQALYATGMDLGDYNPYMHITDPWHDHDANNMAADSRLKTVATRDRQRGDLIFYPGHVAIYLGNDQIINAYPPRVMVENLWTYGTPTVVKRPFV